MKKALSFSTSLLLSLAFVAAPSLQAQEREWLRPAEMLKKLQEADDDKEEGGDDEHPWPEGLPKDLPLYPGVTHQPVFLGVAGYYRWNIQAPTSDRAAIIETVRQGEVHGWKLTDDQKQSVNIHLFQFSREGESLVVTVSNDGTETKTVFYEFMTDAFKEAASRGR
ncbi:MAG TPA: hypothetical protein VNQ90_03155 [Chthoniobacteraceae bacterium]|nr:hypothetical protein [Chthoniobacteraceae bacterium]